MFLETRSEYVSRKVDTFTKYYRRTRELEGLPIDETELRSEALHVKHGAEDSYDFWDSMTPW